VDIFNVTLTSYTYVSKCVLTLTHIVQQQRIWKATRRPDEAYIHHHLEQLYFPKYVIFLHFTNNINKKFHKKHCSLKVDEMCQLIWKKHFLNPQIN
jgi:hypothetical protein